ncbi:MULTISPECIES: autotransporter outer membrane beta-barrel domain-containing protein [unclassified Bartonella]|uniref:autotransporter outer membrane beta-barrel domain-containing protein n=1 Tax=unclassified Bartonella TaxID=2645622 RepID=UPI0009C3BCA8|nr:MULTISPECIES: autotransporter outer membrane beta-barrel domain-containing protein [unclassified Bartonella]AQX27736.1 outer membrane autotransporter barrel domain-containing protein [Bartonella sp. JB15]AQX29018.1 outer membrane autotransporter barrel domain-containing protein [Bartonella sp. JB63]
MKWKILYATVGFFGFPLNFNCIQAANAVESVNNGVVTRPLETIRSAKHNITSDLIGIYADGKAFDAVGYNIGGKALAGIVCDNGCVVNIKDSTVNVSGMNTYGIILKNTNLLKMNTQQKSAGQQNYVNYVNIFNSKFLSPEIGINSNGPGAVTLYNSEIRSNILLDDQSGVDSSYKALPTILLAKNSVLEGRVRIKGIISTFIGLQNSQWILPTDLMWGKQVRPESTVNMLKLINSSVIFDKKVDGVYQTLYIKPAEENKATPPLARPSQYTAVGDARVYFNVGSVDSDKLIIETNVQGVTTVYINHVKDPEQIKSSEKTTNLQNLQTGITLIKAPGFVNENAFKLAHGYIALDGLPYRYILKAVSVPVKEVRTNEPLTKWHFNWHFRLKNEYIDSQSQVRSLVPQMASYLVMPNALFSSGISDINNQNKVLADMRERLVSSKKKGSLFLSSYGNVANFSSIRNPLQYGYGADTVYAALQTGAVLGSFENENIITNFGLLGTYGKVSFTPKDMEGSAKSSLDKWSVSAFGSVQHDNNLYMNALLSYGIVKGHIKTAVIDNVAEIDDTKMFSVSGTVGQKLATGVENVSFEPQAQLIYQSVMFNNILDIDKLQVNMKDPNQWLARVGGRLTKTTVVEKDSVVSFYGKLNVMKTLSASDTIEVGDTFHLDSMGSAIEGGLGINVQLTKKILFHGDASYQKRLSKTGVSGASFSGRLHYRF